MTKTMTTDGAKSSFAAGIGMVPVTPLSVGKNDPVLPINSDSNDSNRANQHRSPTAKHFDLPADRGSSISNSSGAAGMKSTPTSR